VAKFKVIFITDVIKLPDDPKFPWRLEATLRAPSSTSKMSFLIQHGSFERVVVKGKDHKALMKYIDQTLKDHARLISVTITDPDGKEDTITAESLRSS
jgi:hypothetical protein